MSAERGLAVRRWASTRKLYLDNLKIILIAAIIALHGLLGYVGSDQLWSYADVQEVTLSPVTEAAAFVVAGPFALVLIPLLFMVAGLLAPQSLEHKGAGRFVWDRLLRLGVPFLRLRPAASATADMCFTTRSVRLQAPSGRSSSTRVDSTPVPCGSSVSC